MGQDEGVQGISLYENELYGQQELVEPSWDIVVFSAADEWYAADIQFVKEILPPQALTVLPNVPDHILGIISLRGAIVPIINLRSLFGLPASEEAKLGRIIVIAKEKMWVGISVDSAEQVTSVPISKIEKKMPTLQGERADWITGQAEHGGHIVAIVDAGLLLEKTQLKGGQ
jgi:purine-binding chemotaxis protein CheW